MSQELKPYAASAATATANLGGRAQALAAQWRHWLGEARSLVVVALLAALLAAAIVVILWTSGERVVPLYGQHEQYDTAAIVEVLEAERIAFEIDPRTGTVLVPKDKLAAARMKLAARGVSAQLPVGMESLNEVSSLTTSQFMESNRYIYAVEGELARSILTLRNVTKARVHLAIPKRTLFVGREEQTPTASVILELTRKLDESQVEAIVNLVAASVPGMKSGAVSVVDQHGTLLSAGMGENSPERISNKQMDYVQRLEQKVAQAASAMLEPMLGSENFRVRVSAEVDFSKVEETRETLSDNPVLLNETTLSDSAAGQLAMGVPGALTNQPPLPNPNQNEGEGEGAANAERSVNRRQEISRRYGTGRGVTHTRSEEARVKKMSVSILVNDGAAANGAWSEADLDKMTEVASAAVGLNPERGDSLIVQSAPFVARADQTALEPPRPFWQYVVDWQDYLRYLVGGLLALLLMYLGVRPLVTYLIRGNVAPELNASTSVDTSHPLSSLPAGRVEGVAQQPLPAAVTAEAPSEALNLPPPGSELEVQLQHLRLLADQETTRAVEVIKSWINQSERKTG